MLGEGLGFVPDVIVDQHFSERRRLGRLQATVARHPDLLGLGIDENTAIVLCGDAYEVIGTGAVTLVDGRSTSVPSGDDSVATRTFTLRMLGPGQRSRLRTRDLLRAGGAE